MAHRKHVRCRCQPRCVARPVRGLPEDGLLAIAPGPVAVRSALSCF